MRSALRDIYHRGTENTEKFNFFIAGDPASVGTFGDAGNEKPPHRFAKKNGRRPSGILSWRFIMKKFLPAIENHSG